MAEHPTTADSEVHWLNVSQVSSSSGCKRCDMRGWRACRQTDVHFRSNLFLSFFNLLLMQWWLKSERCYSSPYPLTFMSISDAVFSNAWPVEDWRSVGWICASSRKKKLTFQIYLQDIALTQLTRCLIPVENATCQSLKWRLSHITWSTFGGLLDYKAFKQNIYPCRISCKSHDGTLVSRCVGSWIE